VKNAVVTWWPVGGSGKVNQAVVDNLDMTTGAFSGTIKGLTTGTNYWVVIQATFVNNCNAGDNQTNAGDPGKAQAK
jgi:hypothetical protein